MTHPQGLPEPLTRYIANHRATHSRYDIDRTLLAAGYAPTDIDAAWRSLSTVRSIPSLRPVRLALLSILLCLAVALGSFFLPFYTWQGRTYNNFDFEIGGGTHKDWDTQLYPGTILALGVAVFFVVTTIVATTRPAGWQVYNRMGATMSIVAGIALISVLLCLATTFFAGSDISPLFGQYVSPVAYIIAFGCSMYGFRAAWQSARYTPKAVHRTVYSSRPAVATPVPPSRPALIIPCTVMLVGLTLAYGSPHTGTDLRFFPEWVNVVAAVCTVLAGLCAFVRRYVLSLLALIVAFASVALFFPVGLFGVIGLAMVDDFQVGEWLHVFGLFAMLCADVIAMQRVWHKIV